MHFPRKYKEPACPFHKGCHAATVKISLCIPRFPGLPVLRTHLRCPFQSGLCVFRIKTKRHTRAWKPERAAKRPLSTRRKAGMSGSEGWNARNKKQGAVSKETSAPKRKYRPRI